MIQHRRSLLYILLCISVFFLVGTESVFANESTSLSDDDKSQVVNIINGFIAIAATLMGFVTSFITLFLNPGWVNGTMFGLQEYLKIIWVLVSNVVYFIFAFILIVIAFMNIIGRGEGTWELKQAMPRFIVGILIVPFSWFFVQFILSLSAILTVGVLTLPYEAFQDEDVFSNALSQSDIAVTEICSNNIISLSGDFSPYSPESLTSLNLGQQDNFLDDYMMCVKGSEITIEEFFTGERSDGTVSENAVGVRNTAFGIINVYSYGILRIQNLDTISLDDLSTVKTLANLVLKIIFDMLFVVVYLLLMIALFLALFARGIRLWIFMMLSPVFGLLYFFGKTDGGGEETKAFSVKEFIGLALVPVYVSAALSFGLVFILVSAQGIQDNVQGGDMFSIDASGFKITILGAHSSPDGSGSEKSIISKLIVEIFGVVILWIAVMAALRQSETTGNIVKPIADFGKSVGELATKAPQYAPIIPTHQGMQSAQTLQRVGNRLANMPQEQASNRANEFFNGAGSSPDVHQARIIADKFERDIYKSNNDKIEGIQEFIKTLNGNHMNLSTNDTIKESFHKMMFNLLGDEKLQEIGITSAASVSFPKAVEAFQKLKNEKSEIVYPLIPEAVNEGSLKTYIENVHEGEVDVNVNMSDTGSAGNITMTLENNNHMDLNHTSSHTLNENGVNAVAENIKTNFTSGEFTEKEIKKALNDFLNDEVHSTQLDNAVNAVIDKLEGDDDFSFKSSY